MMTKKLTQPKYIVIWLYGLTFTVNAQSLTTGGSHVVLPSPNSWNALNESKADVDLYTGRLNYTIPLHTLKSHELEMPISLQYSSDGIKVDDLASDVGLSWQIQAGGVIGRVMRGLPDEFDGPCTIQLGGGNQATVSAKGFLDANVGDYADKDYFISSSRSVDDRKRIAEFSNRTGDFVSLGQDPKVWDTELDEFYFNFDRYSGKFVFDKNGAIQIIPHQNLLITKIITNNLYSTNEAGTAMITSFQITDNRGIKYTFGNVNPASKVDMTAIEVTKYSLYSVWFQLAYHFDAIATSTAWNQGQLANLFATTPALLLDNEIANYGIDQVDNKQTFTSSWYLTRVESPNGDFINLAYINEDIKYLTGRTHDISQLNLDLYNDGESYFFGTDVSNDIPPAVSATGRKYQGQRFTITTSKSTINSKKLSSVTAATGERVTFESNVSRPDLVGAKRLERINIYNSSNEWIKTYNFNYDLSIHPWEEYLYEFKVATTGGFLYPHEFMGNSGSSNNFWNYIYSSVPLQGDWLAMITADHYRMFLSSVTETFFGGATQKLVSFEYNTDYILPPRLSTKQDYYTYFNSNLAGHTLRNVNYNDTFGTSIQIPVVFASLYRDESGALYMRPSATNHSGVTEKAKAGVLKNIYNRNESKISIEYEQNQGLRVSKISHFQDKDVPVSEDVTYLYSNGQSASISAKFSNVFSTKTINGGATRTSVYSSSVSVNQSLNKTKGGFVGYGIVEKVRTGIGKEIFEFSTPATNANTDYIRYAPESNASGEAIQLSTGDYFPYAPKNNVDYQRGLLKKVTVKSQSGQALKSDAYNYRVNPAGYTPQTIYGLKPGKYVFDGFPIFTAAFYHYKTDWVYLDNVETKIYDQVDPGNESKSVATTAQYYYYRPGESTPVPDLLARKVATTLPTGDIMVNESKYPLDYTTTATPTDITANGIHLLKSKKIESVPIETISYLERTDGAVTSKYLLGASLTKFKEFQSGKIYLWESYKLKAGLGNAFTTYPWATVDNNTFSWTNITNFKLSGSIDSYDTYGNPLTETSEDGIQKTYTWDYNNSLLTSLTQNAGIYQHQASYLHKPLLGVTQVTDPNSRTGKYTYDNYNRLRLERDHDDQITARYRYHYKSQTDGFANASIYASGCPITSQSVTFSSYENLEFGSTIYDWNFGDGSSTSETTAVSHTFSSPGPYNVTVTKRNPEYADFTAQTTFNVYRPVTSVNGSTSGPTSYDVCILTPPSQSTTLTAFFNNGLHAAGDAFSVVWEYRFNGGQWYTMTQLQGPVSSTTVSAPPGFGDPTIVGTWEVRCAGEDACGTSYSTSFTLTNYASNPVCEQY